MTHLSPDHLFVGEATLLDKADETARTVAAVFDLGAIGVVDDVFEVGIGPARPAHAEDLIGAHPKMPIGKPSVLGRIEVQRQAGFIEHDKVVASPVHFGEVNAHGRHYRRLC
jgi:hypothetical protein